VNTGRAPDSLFPSKRRLVLKGFSPGLFGCASFWPVGFIFLRSFFVFFFLFSSSCLPSVGFSSPFGFLAGLVGVINSRDWCGFSLAIQIGFRYELLLTSRIH
jgi:hypothetical protein